MKTQLQSQKQPGDLPGHGEKLRLGITWEKREGNVPKESSGEAIGDNVAQLVVQTPEFGNACCGFSLMLVLCYLGSQIACKTQKVPASSWF